MGDSGRRCERCRKFRWYDAYTKRNTKDSNFYKGICWDCHTTELILKDIAKKRERQESNYQYADARERYAASHDGKEAQKRATMKYLHSDKGKATKAVANARYRAKQAPVEPKPKVVADPLPDWMRVPYSPEAQKAAALRYRQSEKGRAANAAAQARYRAKQAAAAAVPEWLLNKGE